MSKRSIIAIKENRYKAIIGSSVYDVCYDLAKLAKEKGPLSVMFNGFEIKSTGSEKPDELVAIWHETKEKYYNSNEYKIKVKKRDSREKKEKNCRLELNLLLREIPLSFKRLSTTIDWFYRYYKKAHSYCPLIGEEYRLVKQALKNAGFKKNAHVGKPKKEFENPEILGEYVIGQLMDLPNHLGPHDIGETFIEKYHRLCGHEKEIHMDHLKNPYCCPDCGNESKCSDNIIHETEHVITRDREEWKETIQCPCGKIWIVERYI